MDYGGKPPFLYNFKYGFRSKIILSPHGMLHPIALLKSALIKEFLLKTLYKYPQFYNKLSFHVLNANEQNDVKKLFPHSSCFIIPNSITTSEELIRSRKQQQHRNVVFLGRIHADKGIDSLLESWKVFPKK